MLFAINILALLIVLGLCWAAMVWLGGRHHGQSRALKPIIPFEAEYLERLATSGESDNPQSDSVQSNSTQPDNAQSNNAQSNNPLSLMSNAPCTVCEGVGAQQTRGKLAPCPECLGTGVLSQA